MIRNPCSQKLSISAEVCSPTICQNDGTCSEITINNQLTFSCACAPGWTGLTCADDIDECAPEPCQNGGQCINMQNAYMCVCPANFMGVNCEEDRDECVIFAPCENGGNCTNTDGSYNCLCTPQWMGRNCDIDFVSEGTVRLEDGPSNNSGRVEVFTSGLWRSICINTWSIDVANLVCVQLGYLRAEEAYLGQGGVFGQGTGAILEDLQCPEAVTVIQNCSFNISASGSCSHSMDAAVMCTSE